VRSLPDEEKSYQPKKLSAVSPSYQPQKLSAVSPSYQPQKLSAVSQTGAFLADS